MAVSKTVLGMNARNFLYIRPYNKSSAKKNADDKLKTKKILVENGIPAPTLLASFRNRDEVRSFNWDSLPESGFAIKPARGYGGSGIIIIKHWKKNIGHDLSGEVYDKTKLESHIFDILDGAFSLQYLPDTAFIEDKLVQHPFFKKITPMGLTDIRIIVFKHVPIMAMLRIPTQQSGGKANIHLGALATGIDISTGITTSATNNSKLIYKFPFTKKKTAGIKLPNWSDTLLLASRTQEAIKLGFAGVDIVIDAHKGPLVLEVNSRPGLEIQNANLQSLRTRLERIEDMNIASPKRGVELAKTLFAEKFSEKVSSSPKILPVIYPVTLKSNDIVKEINAKLDTGAYRSSIDKKLAKELGLETVKQKVFVRSASGKAYRKTAKLSFIIAGKRINTIVSLVSRSHLTYPMIVGRLDLKGFLINPETDEQEDLSVDV